MSQVNSVEVMDGGINEANAERIAYVIWTGLARGFGGHSMVPTTAYGEAIVGHTYNNCHTFNRDVTEIKKFMQTIARILNDKYEDQWMESQAEELLDEQDRFQGAMEKSITTWIESETAKGNLKVKA